MFRQLHQPVEVVGHDHVGQRANIVAALLVGEGVNDGSAALEIAENGNAVFGCCADVVNLLADTLAA